MPRLSVEARAGAYFRASVQSKPTAPAHLDAETRQLWDELIASRPPDYWDAGPLVLAERFVVMTANAKRWEAALSNAMPGSSEASQLLREIVAANASLTGLATKLRISIQSQYRIESGITSERGVSRHPLLRGRDRDGDPLLGSHVMNGNRKRAQTQ